MKLLSFIYCESLKVIRSKIFWVVIVAFAIMPAMFGIVSSLQPVQLSWASYLDELLGTSTALLVIGFAFTSCWTFGREYTDNTITEVLVKPVSKFYIVIAKFIVISLWDCLLSLFMFAVMLLVGHMVGLGALPMALLLHKLLIFLLASACITIVSTISAFIANITKGYLAPIGHAFLLVIISNIISQAGLAAVFPWTIPSILVTGGQLSLLSIAIVLWTGVIGFMGTVLWWRFTEQS